jgi:hypothetical protein
MNFRDQPLLEALNVFNSTRALWLSAVVLCFVAQATWAAHPLVSEDTGTQGQGNVELEHGGGWTREADNRSFSYQPQLSYGLLPTLDIMVQPSLLYDRSPGLQTATGFGDTALDMKWRFYGNAPLSLAIRAGLLLPTAQNNLGLPSGKASMHTLLVATLDAAPWTLHGNLGYTRNPNTADLRRDVGHASIAAMFAANDHWTLAVDVGIDQNPDPGKSSRLRSMLVGVIYSVRPGLDIDFGYQVGWRDVPTTQALIGATYRWAP